MRIITDNINPLAWNVLAVWFGEERVVFSGDLFACLKFMSDNNE